MRQKEREKGQTKKEMAGLHKRGPESKKADRGRSSKQSALETSETSAHIKVGKDGRKERVGRNIGPRRKLLVDKCSFVQFLSRGFRKSSRRFCAISGSAPFSQAKCEKI